MCNKKLQAREFAIFLWDDGMWERHSFLSVKERVCITRHTGFPPCCNHYWATTLGNRAVGGENIKMKPCFLASNSLLVFQAKRVLQGCLHESPDIHLLFSHRPSFISCRVRWGQEFGEVWERESAQVSTWHFIQSDHKLPTSVDCVCPWWPDKSSICIILAIVAWIVKTIQVALNFLVYILKNIF